MGCTNNTQMGFDMPNIIQKVEGLDDLTKPFSQEEIVCVIKEMPPDIAPGPDGFNGCFLKSCWHIIKHDFYTLCADFYDGKLDLQSLNSGFITLISKSYSPETANDYRPITLLNCYLKLITKLLANRLQKVILKIIHKNQYGFIKTRTIQDCLGWAFEYLHQCKQSGKEIVILKLDFEKAFDTMEHSFILKMLECKGFDDWWCMWIKMLLQSGSSSILLNGILGTEFKCKRGVRQGDPISPLLFVLAADLLQSLINKAWLDGLISLPINQPALEDYPVVEYADYTLIILPANQQELQTIKEILDFYARATGLKINYAKSQLLPINVKPQKTFDLANALGCQVGEMSFTYLGLPLGGTRPTVRELMPLVDRIERRLTGTAIRLSYGERVQLINSALSSLLSFAMCVLKLPLKLIEIFDSARRHCLWRI